MVVSVVLLLAGTAAIYCYSKPYEYVGWYINRKTGETFYITVTAWMFESHREPSIFYINLGQIGDLKAPDKMLLAHRNVYRWYPWSEYDDNSNDEEFEPGMTLWRANRDMFYWLEGPAVVAHYSKETLTAIKKRRLEFWNAQDLDNNPDPLMRAIRFENDRLWDAIPKTRVVK